MKGASIYWKRFRDSVWNTEQRKKRIDRSLTLLGENFFAERSRFNLLDKDIIEMGVGIGPKQLGTNTLFSGGKIPEKPKSVAHQKTKKKNNIKKRGKSR